jgi:hypothetical protein
MFPTAKGRPGLVPLIDNAANDVLHANIIEYNPRCMIKHYHEK